MKRAKMGKYNKNGLQKLGKRSKNEEKIAQMEKLILISKFKKKIGFSHCPRPSHILIRR